MTLPYWEDDKYKKLLKPTIVAKSKSMVQKIPMLIEMAENYNIDNYINTKFLLMSPSQNYALIMYLSENNTPLVVNGKLHPIFGKQSTVLKNKYDIDIKELMTRYSFNEKNDKGRKNK